jgi:two-component system response regulator DevR
MPKGETPDIRLLLVDDHEVLRLGLRTLFSEAGGFQVAGEAGTMAEAIAQGLALKPDVVLMDVRLPDGSGIEACREIRAGHPETRVLFLTTMMPSSTPFWQERTDSCSRKSAERS